MVCRYRKCLLYIVPTIYKKYLPQQNLEEHAVGFNLLDLPVKLFNIDVTILHVFVFFIISKI
jgi:hypothetical protein